MSDTSVATILSRLPLSSNEQRVYQACLEQGPQTVLQLSRVTGIKRSTVYGVTEDLQKKGLLGGYQQRTHKVWYAERPEAIDSFLEASAREITEQRAAFAQHLPTLALAQVDGALKPTVTLHHGQAELRALFKSLITKDLREYLFVSDPETLENMVGASFVRDLLENVKKLNARGILTGTPAKGKLRAIQHRLASAQFQAPLYTGIFGDTVVSASPAAGGFAMAISSRDFASTQRSWFDEMWEHAAPIA